MEGLSDIECHGSMPQQLASQQPSNRVEGLTVLSHQVGRLSSVRLTGAEGCGSSSGRGAGRLTRKCCLLSMRAWSRADQGNEQDWALLIQRGCSWYASWWDPTWHVDSQGVGLFKLQAGAIEPQVNMAV